LLLLDALRRSRRAFADSPLRHRKEPDFFASPVKPIEGHYQIAMIYDANTVCSQSRGAGSR